MSLRPVFGRSSMVASRLIMCLYLSRIGIVTTARPSLRSTFLISPTGTPAMSTVWPWPGVTDWAVANSAFSSKKSVPSTGTQAGR